MLRQKKYVFLDRDGTLIEEPADFQVDCIEKLHFMPGVIPALLQLKQAGFSLVMISNQDGLGTSDFPVAEFNKVQEWMLRIFASQDITFEAILICPHLPIDRCTCRKPALGLVMDFLVEQKMERAYSYVIGDRETDMQLARNMGIKGIKIQKNVPNAWKQVAKQMVSPARRAEVMRTTKETAIQVVLHLDYQNEVRVATGIGFLDHMLEQLAAHAGIDLLLLVKGDVHIDDHHTVEDTAIALGEALRKALSDKIGIGRYGFLLPMDEALAEVAIDLSGRAFCQFSGKFTRERVGDLSTELISHFFHSFSQGLQATLHIKVKGKNNHHMIESIFKGVGRALRQAITKIDLYLPSTKGVL